MFNRMTSEPVYTSNKRSPTLPFLNESIIYFQVPSCVLYLCGEESGREKGAPLGKDTGKKKVSFQCH